LGRRWIKARNVLVCCWSGTPEHAGGHGQEFCSHAAHHHAEVLGLDDDAHAARPDRLLDGLRDLHGEALLDLEAGARDVHEARDLGEADDLAVGR